MIRTALNGERQHYADDPAMLALTGAIHSHEFRLAIMGGTIRATPERTEEEWFLRAAELIEEYTERLRRDDIRDLLRRVESGEVEFVIDGETVLEDGMVDPRSASDELHPWP